MMARMAGGVAHEFNNVLAVILLQADMLLKTPGQDETNRQRGLDIKRAAERAATLTRQLLAFAGKPVMHQQTVDLNNELETYRTKIKQVLGRKVDLLLRLGSGVGQVNIDPVYLEQVLLILAANARDAMSDGGRVIISTETSHDQALLSFADSGSGMDPETRAHVFEPFFTTKPTGKGIGLGLSTVYGIVKKMNGRIALDSTPGQGTTFKILLQQTGEAPAQNPISEHEGQLRGSEIILLVDDEAMVRRATSELLEMFGYQVIEAATGKDALEICNECDEPIGLVLTDITMDEMDGRKLARAIKAEWPEIPVLLMSGDIGAAMSVGDRDEGVQFIEKPFEPEELMRRIRRIIDRKQH